MVNRDELVKKLQGGVLTIIFTKVNGELREMKCTLSPEVLPTLRGSNHKRNSDVLPVWDVEKSAWRSFRLDSIKEIN